MKRMKYYALLFLATVVMFGCSESEYDDSGLKTDIKDLKSRVEQLEAWCSNANSQITGLQTLVTALQENDGIKSVEPYLENNKQVGYKITFVKNEPIIIRNGADGASTGEASTPIIGVEEVEGVYYWTVKYGNDEPKFIMNGDDKVPAAGPQGPQGPTGTTGTPGTPGTPGHTPVLSVETSDGILYWQIDGEWLLKNGAKVPATGEQGDAIFAKDGIDLTNLTSVTFTLADGVTKITLPRVAGLSIGFDSYETFTVTPNFKEITLVLPANMLETDYTAIKAEITNNFGTGTNIQTRTEGSTPWQVEITKPSFTPEGVLVAGSAKVTITVPADFNTGDVALLKVTIIDSEGNESSSTRVIKYDSAIAEVESVIVDPDEATIYVGESRTLSVEVLPQEVAVKDVTWSSLNEDVAKVDNQGKVTALKAGNTTITATSVAKNTITGTCEITVKDVVVTGITLAPTASVGVDLTITLTATVNPSNATFPAITWSSKNEAVATVNQSGIVKGISAGTAVIVVTSDEYPDVTAECTVTVKKPYAVGDLYPDAENAVGVVFWVDPDNSANGKVVSLDEAHVKWATSNSSKIGASDENDGAKNIEAFTEIGANEFPAFEWCYNKPEIDGKKWYLPAIEEVRTLAKSTTTINTILEANGTKMEGIKYWSSTEYVSAYDGSSTSAYVTEVENAAHLGNKEYERKTSNTYFVRAILAY